MVSNFFDTHRGGLDIVAGRLARELAARGFEVSWLASDKTPPPDDACRARVRTISVPVWNVTERRLGVPFPLLPPRALGALHAGVRDADVVLLHDSLYPTCMATALYARRTGTPLLVLQHIGHVPYRNPALRALMALANATVGAQVLQSADRVVFISEFVRDFFNRRRFKAPPELIFNGVDTGLFRPAAPGEKAAARARLSLPDAPIALFAGRFVEKKGVHLLRLSAQRRPDLTWAFAGWGVIDPQRWGLANVRVFEGLSQDALAELYRASDVFVLPSQGEGFPLVVQEALACGLPVVCGDECLGSDRSAAPFLVGLDVGSGSEVAIAERVADATAAAIAADTPERAAQRAEFVATRYAWSAAADQYAAVLEALARERTLAGSVA
jgi:glycosyltransferase involved in cell wall biosynthesis